MTQAPQRPTSLRPACARTALRSAVAITSAALLAGCVQPPAYFPPPPIELQSYPPPIPYRTNPAYRPPIAAPATEPLPLIQPLPPPDAVQSDESGPIPLQQMPAPATDASATGAPASVAMPAPQPEPATPTARPATSGPGSNIPLEGFRPMRGQTRPTP